MAPKPEPKKDVDFNFLAKKLEDIGTNVAGLKADINTVKTDVKALEGLKQDVLDIKEENKKLSNKLTQSIRDNVDKLKVELLAKINDVKENLDIDISTVQNQLGTINQRLHAVESRVSEQKQYQTACTIVITGIAYDPTEDINAIAEDVITEGLGISGVTFIRAKRYAAKPHLGRNGVIKVEFANEVLRDRICESSKVLNNKDGYKHIYVNKCRTGAELIQRRNMIKLKNKIPGCQHMNVNYFGELYEPSYRGVGRGDGIGSRGRGDGGRGRGDRGRGRGGDRGQVGGRGGTAGTSNGAGRGASGTGGTSNGTDPGLFDGSVFTRAAPDIGNMNDFPNLNGDADSIASHEGR